MCFIEKINSRAFVGAGPVWATPKMSGRWNEKGRDHLKNEWGGAGRGHLQKSEAGRGHIFWFKIWGLLGAPVLVPFAYIAIYIESSVKKTLKIMICVKR